MRLQYRIIATMVPATTQSKNSRYQLFTTKRSVFITRKSGLTNKHFSAEVESDYVNIRHKDWSENPALNLGKTGAKLYVSVDRMFYYSGDSIDISVMIDNMNGGPTCKGLEVSLVRFI